LSKSYEQYCPIAHALDLVGERWSLLIVRELRRGPLRYTDLRERLPGCSTNMLAERLKTLEGGGVVCRRRLPPPAASAVYELTEVGRGLAPVLRELALWGARTLGPPEDDVPLPTGWLEGVLTTAFGAGPPADLRLTFRSGDEVASLAGGVVVPGSIESPDAIVTCTLRGFYFFAVEGLLDGLDIDGDRRAVEELAASLARPAPGEPVKA
jgi:DNA-binding HxlR family transcriptional regulator